MLERLRRRADLGLFLAKVLRATGVAAPIRPTSLARFLRGARQVKPGPHLAVMFHAATHPDKEAIVEYGAPLGRARRMTWGEFDAAINRLANALHARGVT